MLHRTDLALVVSAGVLGAALVVLAGAILLVVLGDAHPTVMTYDEFRRWQ